MPTGFQNDRRDFLKKFGSGLAGITIVGSLAPLLEACSSPTSSGATETTGSTKVVDVSSLTADNMGIAATSPAGNPLLIIRLSSTTYETLVMICKHESCMPPSMALNNETISCSCHGSQYDITGKVTRGPARQNLDSHTTTFDAVTKKVTITF
jgi:cytochrome b6-f complex iron-sulfur subunit